MSKLIDAEAQVLGGANKVFVGGFSQGCAISLATFLTYSGKLGGAVGLSGAQSSKVDWDKIDMNLKR